MDEDIGALALYVATKNTILCQWVYYYNVFIIKKLSIGIILYQGEFFFRIVINNFVYATGIDLLDFLIILIVLIFVFLLLKKLLLWIWIKFFRKKRKNKK